MVVSSRESVWTALLLSSMSWKTAGTILFDVNGLVYAHRPDSPNHEAAYPEKFPRQAHEADRDRTAPGLHRSAPVVHTTGAEPLPSRADESSTAAEKNRSEEEQTRTEAEQ